MQRGSGRISSGKISEEMIPVGVGTVGLVLGRSQGVHPIVHGLEAIVPVRNFAFSLRLIV